MVYSIPLTHICMTVHMIQVLSKSFELEQNKYVTSEIVLLIKIYVTILEDTK